MALERKFLISYLTYSINKQTRYYLVLLRLFLMPRDFLLPESSRNRSKFVVVQTDNSARGFVILSVFAAHFTDNLHLRSSVYSIRHVYFKK
jgi:hypothetical protein